MAESRKIAIASDHAGRELKDELVGLLKRMGEDVLDLGTATDASVDYPDYGSKVAELVSNGEVSRGVLVCGTGIGMSILANKYPNVRAALAHDVYTARLSREHNDSNILVIGGRVVGKGLALEMLKTWMETSFEGGRHQSRLDKITEVERKKGRT